MIEISPRLFVGDALDYEERVRFQRGWAVVQACTEPYHRAALGYKGRAAPTEHPEYLVALRGNRLILNLVDTDNPDWIAPALVDAALQFVHAHLVASNKVLIHCNLGVSRSPALGLLYLAQYTDELPTETFLAAEAAFRSFYPAYSPAMGMRGFMLQNWDKYTTRA